MASYTLDTLRYVSTTLESATITSIVCNCHARQIDEFCNILLCGYPALKKIICRNPEIDHIPALLFCRLEELDISGTNIASLPTGKSVKIKKIDASNTRVDPHELIKNYPTLEYCKTGYLEHSPNYDEFPRKVYETPLEILAVRCHLLREPKFL